MSNEPDWKSIAVRLFRAEGNCYLLHDWERDALLAADEQTPKGPDDDAARGGHGLIAGIVETMEDWRRGQ